MTAEAEVWLWNTATAKPIGLPLRHEPGLLRGIVFSGDSKAVLTIGTPAYLVEASTGMPRCPPLRPQDGILSGIFSPDNTKILTGGDGTARLWDSTTGKPLGHPLQHQGPVMALAFSPDGQTVLTAARKEQTARLWAVYPGKLLCPPDNLAAAAATPRHSVFRGLQPRRPHGANRE